VVLMSTVDEEIRAWLLTITSVKQDRKNRMYLISKLENTSCDLKGSSCFGSCSCPCLPSGLAALHQLRLVATFVLFDMHVAEAVSL